MTVKISDRAHRLLLKLAEQSTCKLAEGYGQGFLDCLRLLAGEDATVLAKVRYQEWVEQGEIDGSDRARLLEILIDFLGESEEGECLLS